MLADYKAHQTTSSATSLLEAASLEMAAFCSSSSNNSNNNREIKEKKLEISDLRATSALLPAHCHQPTPFCRLCRFLSYLDA